jgi:hypothetical protein
MLLFRPATGGEPPGDGVTPPSLPVWASLGVVSLAASLGQGVPFALDQARRFALPSRGSHGIVLSWAEQTHVAELLLCPIVERLRAGWEDVRRRFRAEQEIEIGPRWTDDAWGAVWRLRARVALPPAMFTATFEARSPGVEGDGGGSGEGWADYAWSDGSTVVAIGTEVAEGLGHRAARGDGLPRRLAEGLRGVDALAYRQDGFGVGIPSLEAGELCQVHFAIAWGPYRVPAGEYQGEVNSDPTLDTDLNARFILESAGLT